MRLGDVLERVFYITGIYFLVKKISHLLNIKDCGCERRRNILNNITYLKK